MNFQVPQFIDIEDKIFGPLSFRQFVYVAGALGAAFIAYSYLPLFLAVFFIVPFVAFGLALAFYKINNRPFIVVVEAAVRYFLTSKLYLWQKKAPLPTTPTAAPTTPAVKPILNNLPKLSQSKLRDLAWSLDIKEKIK